MAISHDELLKLGICKTVYSLPWPEARALMLAKQSQAEELMALHDRPWEKRQDGMHEGFRDAWLAFADKAGVKLSPEATANFYPTAGASEPIRETLALIGSKGAGLAVFEGEYEGFEAVATALGMRIAKIRREDWRSELPKLWSQGFELFVSNPSAIDGCHWAEFADCAKLASLAGGRIHLDLTYVGACANPLPIDASEPSIASVVFSLSKVFGVYYRRMGGAFSREANPLLWGNQWFKNLDSLVLGEELLRSFDPGELPRKWAAQRDLCIGRLAAERGWELAPSDVFMLAMGSGSGLDGQGLSRRQGGPARVCLTPMLGEAIALAFSPLDGRRPKSSPRGA